MHDRIRPITMIGFTLSLLSLLAISYSLTVAMILGGCGMVVSLCALLTSKDEKHEE